MNKESRKVYKKVVSESPPHVKHESSIYYDASCTYMLADNLKFCFLVNRQEQCGGTLLHKTIKDTC